MAESAAATSKTLATAKQYNDLRNDVLSTTLGHMHDGTNARVHTDDTIFALGTDKDIALVSRSTILAANTALTGVLVGTPVTPAVAANSLILANITASGDILIAGNLGGNSRAYLFADVSADTLDLMTAGISRILLGAGGLVAINDTANTNMTIGLTINQGAQDNQALALKSSDVAHGLTSAAEVAAETDDYFSIQKRDGATGGAIISVFSEDSGGAISVLRIIAHGGGADTVAAATASGLIQFLATEHDGANALAATPAGGLVFGVAGRPASNRALFFIDVEGDLFVDGSTTVTAFDEWDDVKLVRAFDHSRTDQLIRSRWDEFVTYGRQDLIAAGILSNPPNPNDAMVNITQLQRLHNGAIWQLGTISMAHEERLERLEQENLALRGELMALKGG